MLYQCATCKKRALDVPRGVVDVVAGRRCPDCGKTTWARLFRNASLYRGVVLYRDQRSGPSKLWALRKRDMTLHVHHPEQVGDQTDLFE